MHPDGGSEASKEELVEYTGRKKFEIPTSSLEEEKEREKKNTATLNRRNKKKRKGK